MKLETKAFIMILFSSALSSSAALASGNITLPLTSEDVEGSTKICVYSNSIQIETVQVSDSAQCPNVKTFEADE